MTQDDVPDKSILRIKGAHAQGLSFNPKVIHYGSNSGFQALNIAVLMGAKRIILLGYDMRFSKDNKSHWFGDHPDNVRSNYTSWLSNYGVAAAQLNEKGIEVINCSPISALTCFRMESLESALSSEPVPALQASR